MPIKKEKRVEGRTDRTTEGREEGRTADLCSLDMRASAHIKTRTKSLRRLGGGT